MRSVAYVVSVSNGIAEIVLGMHLECRQCGGCLAAMSEKERRLEVSNDIGAGVGQRVEIEIKPAQAVGAAFLMFVFPVVAALALGLAASHIARSAGLPGDLFGIGVGALGFVCSFLILRHIERSGRSRIPRIVKLLRDQDRPEGGC
jgi:sigma-E factor negative regulatory protein RseC